MILVFQALYTMIDSLLRWFRIFQPTPKLFCAKAARLFHWTLASMNPRKDLLLPRWAVRLGFVAAGLACLLHLPWESGTLDTRFEWDRSPVPNTQEQDKPK